MLILRLAVLLFLINAALIQQGRSLGDADDTSPIVKKIKIHRTKKPYVISNTKRIYFKKHSWKDKQKNIITANTSDVSMDAAFKYKRKDHVSMKNKNQKGHVYPMRPTHSKTLKKRLPTPSRGLISHFRYTTKRLVDKYHRKFLLKSTPSRYLKPSHVTKDRSHYVYWDLDKLIPSRRTTSSRDIEHTSTLPGRKYSENELPLWQTKWRQSNKIELQKDESTIIDRKSFMEFLYTLNNTFGTPFPNNITRGSIQRKDKLWYLNSNSYMDFFYTLNKTFGTPYPYNMTRKSIEHKDKLAYVNRKSFMEYLYTLDIASRTKPEYSKSNETETRPPAIKNENFLSQNESMRISSGKINFTDSRSGKTPIPLRRFYGSKTTLNFFYYDYQPYDNVVGHLRFYGYYPPTILGAYTYTDSRLLEHLKNVASSHGYIYTVSWFYKKKWFWRKTVAYSFGLNKPLIYKNLVDDLKRKKYYYSMTRGMEYTFSSETISDRLQEWLQYYTNDQFYHIIQLTVHKAGKRIPGYVIKRGPFYVYVVNLLKNRQFNKVSLEHLLSYTFTNPQMSKLLQDAMRQKSLHLTYGVFTKFLDIHGDTEKAYFISSRHPEEVFYEVLLENLRKPNLQKIQSEHLLSYTFTAAGVSNLLHRAVQQKSMDLTYRVFTTIVLDRYGYTKIGYVVASRTDDVYYSILLENLRKADFKRISNGINALLTYKFTASHVSVYLQKALKHMSADSSYEVFKMTVWDKDGSTQIGYIVSSVTVDYIYSLLLNNLQSTYFYRIKTDHLLSYAFTASGISDLLQKALHSNSLELTYRVFSTLVTDRFRSKRIGYIVSSRTDDVLYSILSDNLQNKDFDRIKPDQLISYTFTASDISNLLHEAVHLKSLELTYRVYTTKISDRFGSTKIGYIVSSRTDDVFYSILSDNLQNKEFDLIISDQLMSYIFTASDMSDLLSEALHHKSLELTYRVFTTKISDHYGYTKIGYIVSSRTDDVFYSILSDNLHNKDFDLIISDQLMSYTFTASAMSNLLHKALQQMSLDLTYRVFTMIVSDPHGSTKIGYIVSSRTDDVLYSILLDNLQSTKFDRIEADHLLSYAFTSSDISELLHKVIYQKEWDLKFKVLSTMVTNIDGSTELGYFVSHSIDDMLYSKLVHKLRYSDFDRIKLKPIKSFTYTAHDVLYLLLEFIHHTGLEESLSVFSTYILDKDGSNILGYYVSDFTKYTTTPEPGYELFLSIMETPEFEFSFGPCLTTSTVFLPNIIRTDLEGNERRPMRASTPAKIHSKKRKHLPTKVYCYVCGLNEPDIPSSSCSQVFDSNDKSSKKTKSDYKVRCLNGTFKGTRKDEWVGSLYRGGCFKRYTDVGGEIYNERGCRTMVPTEGKSFASKRFARLEMMLKDEDEGCVSSPYASLTPISRSVSLYVRYHVCVCQGRYCNGIVRSAARIDIIFIVLVLIFLSY